MHADGNIQCANYQDLSQMTDYLTSHGFADTGGLNYWLGQLNSGAETRYEALLGFAESAENKALFTDMTGFG